MSEQLSHHPKALQLLFNEDLYQIEPAVLPEPAPQEQQPEAPVATVPDFDYLGDNNRFFLLLVNEAGEKYLENSNREVLQKILAAKGLEMKDVAILNVNRYPGIDFKQLKSFFSCSRICLFDIAPQALGLPDMPSNEVNSHDDVKVLATFSIKELQQTQHKKVAFWNVMKNF